MTHLETDKRPFVFGSKSATLALLCERISLGRVCDQIEIGARDWNTDTEAVCARIEQAFAPRPLAIRSSAAGEDGWSGSLAGAFESCIDVPAMRDTVKDAVTRVFTSYGSNHPDHAVLVQPMVQNIRISGVLTTRVIDSGSPYFVVNFDDTSGRSDTVTSGIESKTIMVRHGHEDSVRSSRFRKLISVAREIEEITCCTALDIEFCITADEEVFVLQVRPIVASRAWPAISGDRFERTIETAKSDLSRLLAPHPATAGRTNAFGNMPDWNPAEIVGPLPRPLALSLYETLITNDVWARARASMGYRDMGTRPLLRSFCGRPYVDIRLSLNSFLPAQVHDDLAGRLVDHQIALLAEHREDHDKIEFRIAVTSLDFAFENRAKALAAAGFSADDLSSLRDGLRRITDDALASHPNGLAALLDGIRTNGAGTGNAVGADPQDRARRLVTNCRRHGTLPFAILARHAFIGVSFLRSLVECGILTADDVLDFQHGIETVAGDFVRDSHALSTGAKSMDDFLGRYGHLRPGTYDILSKRYDERPDLYLSGHSAGPPTKAEPFSLSAGQLRAIDRLLAEAGLGGDGRGLLDYIAAAVRGREEAKFAFTRLVSEALVQISRWGESIGLDDETLSFLAVDQVLKPRPDPSRLRAKADAARAACELNGFAYLPNLLFGPHDLDVVRLPLGRPTFITQARVQGPVRIVESHEVPAIDDRIVLIEQADPGFDWIFSHRILGLVTQYGGANSHMAIRCAEFGLPAAIGCGERLFTRLSRAPSVELNCANQTIRILEH